MNEQMTIYLALKNSDSNAEYIDRRYYKLELNRDDALKLMNQLEEKVLELENVIL